MSVGLIIPAGGSGRRMGLKTAKQYLKIKGVRILNRTLSVFNNHAGISEIVVVLPEEDVGPTGFGLKKSFNKISSVVAGGKERTISVRNGFSALQKKHDIILVHDAVRPFVRPEDIKNVIQGAKKYDAVTLAVPVKDTIKIVDKTKILGTPNRNTLWHTLTPQGFKYKKLKSLLDHAMNHNITGTDECVIAETMGMDVHVVTGHYFNIKITTKEDLVIADAIAGFCN